MDGSSLKTKGQAISNFNRQGGSFSSSVNEGTGETKYTQCDSNCGIHSQLGNPSGFHGGCNSCVGDKLDREPSNSNTGINYQLCGTESNSCNSSSSAGNSLNSSSPQLSYSPQLSCSLADEV